MIRSPEHLDTDFDRERDANVYQMVYLTRRPGYEFAFLVPTTHAAYLSGAQALPQVRFRKLSQGREFVLDLKALEDFYESLSRLMEYVSIERQKGPQQSELRLPPDS
jgi:hypothetical protein